ncbi:MAG TPA: hypothetical protein VGI64_14665 [Streptosporangiaceae bacterium]|jgi:hypothetical protein
MRRNIVVLRTAVKLAATASGVALAITACAPVQMGAAAIVGGDRISSATLTAQSASLRKAIQTDPAKSQVTYPQTQVPQQVLSWLLRFRVRDELAAQQQVTVSQAQQQAALATLASQLKQSGNVTLPEAAIANGLPPDLLPELGRYLSIGNQLLARLDGGQTPTTQAAQNALTAQLNKSQCLASKQLNIKVNPQFGAFDYNQLSVVPAKSTLSAPQPGTSVAPSPAASPSASAQLTPPC